MKKSDLTRAHEWTKGLRVSTRNEKMRNTAMTACLRLATVLDIVSGVNDVTGMPGEPCTLHSQNAVKKLRELLGIKAPRAKTAKAAKKPEQTARAEEVDPASEMTCGKPPYVAEIVRASGTGTLWTAPVRYRSEHAAEIAIIQRATLLKHRCSGLSRHWITENAEHMIDYGSHFYYGRIMNAENWMTMKKEAK